MRVDVLTIFPELFEPFVRTSLLGRARDSGRLEVAVHDLRDFTSDPHRVVDDEPYGGGPGMVMTAPPWLHAVAELDAAGGAWRVLMTPRGRPLAEAAVRRLAARPHLMLLCGRYEGLDERVRQKVVDEEISLGDYVLAGGEIPAMALIEAVSRQVPGVVGRQASVERDSFRHGLLDFPQYTRPRVVAGLGVPEVLLSGDHRAIERWRLKESLRLTRQRRPDLLAVAALDGEARALLAEIRAEEGRGPGPAAVEP